MTEFIGEI